MTKIEELRQRCAARVAALADALRAIPSDLKPESRSTTVAIREQIYYGWEKPMARARGLTLLYGKYEVEGWWSVAAAEMVLAGQVERGSRLIEREHVFSAADLAHDILRMPRTAAETADLLDERVVTCTVLAIEHRLLSRGSASGWQRYREHHIEVQKGLSGTPSTAQASTS